MQKGGKFRRELAMLVKLSGKFKESGDESKLGKSGQAARFVGVYEARTAGIRRNVNLRHFRSSDGRRFKAA